MITIVFEQISIMFIILVLGVICGKVGLITGSVIDRLSTLLLQVIAPIVIFVSYQTDYSSALLSNLLASFAFSVVAFILQIIIAYVSLSRKRADFDVERMSVIYSNCGFFGIPIVLSLFGQEGVFYLTGYLTVLTAFFWTQGVILVAGRTSWRQMTRILLSPAVVGVVLGVICFLLQLRLPPIILKPLEMVGSMNTPLAMLVAGATIASSNLFKVLVDIRIYVVGLLKLLVVPMVVALALSVMKVNAMVALVIIVAAAAPPGASNTMIAIRYKRNSAYASQLFVTNTLMAILTIPTAVWFANTIGIVL